MASLYHVGAAMSATSGTILRQLWLRVTTDCTYDSRVQITGWFHSTLVQALFSVTSSEKLHQDWRERSPHGGEIDPDDRS